MKQHLLFIFCIISLGLTAQLPSYVPTNGLVGWWPFNGNANDESGNVNNGTINGATLTTDRFGVANKAYSFNPSSNSNVTIPFSNSLNSIQNGITLSAWIYMDGGTPAGTPPRILELRGAYGGGGDAGFVMLSTTNNATSRAFELRWYNNNGNSNLNFSPTNSTLTTLNWHLITFTADGTNGTAKYYFDGVLQSTSTNSIITQCNYNNNSLILGAEPNLLGKWGGKLDDIAIYNRALTQQEITNLYSGSTPPTITTSAAPTLINCGESTTLTASSISATQPCTKADLPATLQNGLVGYWPFCGNANDASGNNNNGTVIGATLTSDRFGNANSAYSFDGVNDYISISNSLFTQGPFCFSGWVYSNDNSYFNPIVGFGELGGPNTNRLYIASPFAQIGTEGMNDISSATSFSVSTGWHHWVVNINAYNVNAVSFYCDGQLLTGNTTNGANIPFPLNNVGFTFGKHTGSSTTTYANAILDDISIYNRALTATEIQQLYTLGNVNYSWSPGGATSPTITVSPTQTTTFTCTASNTAGSTTSSVTVTVADTLTWLGQFDTDWHKPCNWSPQFVPQCCNNVVVPFKSNQPIVSGVAAAEDVTINSTSGAVIRVNAGANLQIGQCPITTTQTACPSLAVVTTSSVSSITQTTAISGGTISYQGASAISARGICWSTSANPTLANSFTTNGTGVGTFTANLTGLIAGTTYYVRAFATNASGTSYGNEVSFSSQTLAAQYPAGSVFCAGPTAIVDVTNPTTGKTWMDRNLGASQAATSATDASAYGDLYQWGRRTDGHQCRTSATTTTLSTTDQPGHGNFIIVSTSPNDWRSPQNDNLWQGVNGVNNPCPTGYRIPTEVEFNNERLSLNINTVSGAFASLLKLTMAVARLNTDGTIGAIGNLALGNYWCSTINNFNAKSFSYDGSGAGLVNINRGHGLSVRCIKN